LDDPADGPDGFNDLTDVLDPLIVAYATGTTAARPPAPAAGTLYWNTDTQRLEFYNGTAWGTAGGSSSAAAQLQTKDVGQQNQIRAGRQLAPADFTNLGLSVPIGLWNLSDLTNLGTDGRALANKGAVPFDTGINGLATTAARFSGSTSQALYIADSGAADPFRIRTGSWGCWFRTAKRGTTQRFFSKMSAAAGQYCWSLWVHGGNALAFEVSTDGSNLAQPVGVSDVADDRWHHGVATHDGTTMRLYVDGVLEATFSLSGPIFAGSGPLNIGGYGADAGTAAANPHFGRVDEAFVTADILTEDQIRCLYAAKLTHSLGVVPAGVRLNVHRRRKGAALTVSDFATQPLRLHNFTAGSLNDEGSNGQALTNNGTAIAVAGADGTPGNAFSFAGAQSLSATDAGLPSGTAARSYGCWLKTATLSGSSGTVIGWGTIGTADARLFVNGTNGTLGCASGADGTSGSVFVADGQWHFAVAVEDNAAGDGVRRKLYLDGRLIGVSTVLNTLTLAGANRFRVGANQDGTGPLTGQTDGAFVTGYALTAAEVAGLYQKASQDLGASPKNAGDHVERVDATSVLFIGDMLEPQWTVDLGVVA